MILSLVRPDLTHDPINLIRVLSLSPTNIFSGIFPVNAISFDSVDIKEMLCFCIFVFLGRIEIRLSGRAIRGNSAVPYLIEYLLSKDPGPTTKLFSDLISIFGYSTKGNPIILSIIFGYS